MIPRAGPIPGKVELWAPSSAAAALVIASGVIGAHPTPAEIITRLTDSADPMGNPYFYGSGLLDAARAAGG